MTNSVTDPGRFAVGWRKYLWLAAGAALGGFALHNDWSISIAGWLFLICLMRFTRSSGILLGFGCSWLASAVATVVFLFAGNRFSFGPILFGCLAISTILTLPLLVDRLLFARLTPLLATLIFPTTRVATEFLVAAVSPFGTIFGPLAGTQSANLPLLQLVSVTGIYGISFLMAWAAPVANLALEKRLSWWKIRTVTLAFTALLGLVLLGGGIRLAVAPAAKQTVRVAGVSSSVQARQSKQALDNFHTPDVTPDQKPQLRRAFAFVTDDLFLRSTVEAHAGAKIIVWPEAGALTLHDDLPALLSRAADFARTQHVYLEMGVGVILDNAPYTRDMAVLVDPNGKALWEFDKAHPVPGLEDFPAGDGKVPVASTPFGRLANVICFDADFPGTLRPSGGQADIMLVPANDWQGIEKMHSENAVFRAVENGYSVVRQASNGIAVTTDNRGVALATTNFFSTPQQNMIAYVPIRGTWTIYSAVGDLFAWLCAAAMIALCALAIVRPTPTPIQG
ncbi:nitrilase-related carbon-nitrogen hydrolase [Fodinicola feengrottensis]